jgi:CRP-like cAMP-binding protein
MSDTSARFTSGKVIFRQGDKGDVGYVVRSGKVRIFRESEGIETTLATLGVGELFGEMALLQDLPRSASAEAVGDVDLEVVSRAGFEASIKDPKVWLMLKKMSGRIREVDEALGKLSQGDAKRREFVSNFQIRRDWFA